MHPYYNPNYKGRGLIDQVSGLGFQRNLPLRSRRLRSKFGSAVEAQQLEM